MNDKLRHYDFERLVQEARMERSIAIGNAIANAANAVCNGFERAFALIAHGVSSAWTGHAPRSADSLPHSAPTRR